MDEELIVFLRGMETRLRDGLGEKVSESESRLRTDLHEHIAKAVTDLLADNQRWARIHENRERCFNLRVNEFDQKFALLEERIRELENYYLRPAKK